MKPRVSLISIARDPGHWQLRHAVVDTALLGLRFVFSDFLERIGADTTAKYIGFECADDYTTSIDMATALHPQTLLTFRFADQILPPKYGFPMKLRMPTKLGFKNPKHITAMVVTNDYLGGYWEDQGYNWFSGS
jgi:DMSO/TMAO reductase YedYZ molybdopterin-dependent catalytic subunit